MGNEYVVYRTDDRAHTHTRENGPFQVGLIAWNYAKEIAGPDAVYAKLPAEMHQPGDGCLRQCYMIATEDAEQ